MVKRGKPILCKEDLGDLPVAVRHIKGGRYAVTAIAQDSEEPGRELVIYKSADGKTWARGAKDSGCGFFVAPEGEAGRFFLDED